jgi:hypothetical protein
MGDLSEHRQHLFETCLAFSDLYRNIRKLVSNVAIPLFEDVNPNI